MRHETHLIPGDTPGLEYALRSLHFDGSGEGPAVYIQAGLHAQELPGLAAIHYLLPMLLKAEVNGQIRSNITIVPHANPIGLAQSMFHEQSGRFDFNTRVNFNRGFPLPGGWVYDEQTGKAVDLLKATLMRLSADADIVLDLHCDDEGPVYLYVPAACWPQASALAGALHAEAVLTWEGEGGGAFEDAVVQRFIDRAKGGKIPGKVVSTVELRGMADVTPQTGMKDAEGLWRYLVAIGAVKGAVKPSPMGRAHLVRDQSFVDILRTPLPGMILYHVKPGETVKAGAVIAEIVAVPGEEGGVHDVRAPRDGFVLTRRIRRFARRGDDIAKIIGNSPSETTSPGPLEP
jgi:uncharacterized protein